MTDETRNLVTRRSALGLMGIGAVGVASETLGFTNVTAGRGVNVGVENDDNAVLTLTVGETALNDFDSGEDLIDIDFTANTDFDGDSLETESGVAVEIDVSQSDVDVSSDDFTISETTVGTEQDDVIAAHTDLNTSDSATLTLETNEDGTNSDVDTFRVVASNGVRLDLDRSFTIEDTSE